MINGASTLARLSRIGSNIAGWGTLASNFLYQPATNRTYAWRYGDGVPKLVTLDTDGRVTRLDSGVALNLSYGYHLTDTIRTLSNHNDWTLSSEFGYDANDRLKTVSKSSGDNQGFDWDKVGNLKTHSRAGASWTFSPQPNANRLADATGSSSRVFGYDNTLGNLTSDTQGARSYGYDCFNRLNAVRVNGSLVGDYRSNAFNQRV